MVKRNNTTAVISWSGIIAALVIFFNPDVGIIDVIPDFLGYLILCAAISKAADIDDRLDEARGLFRRMVYISLAKFLSILILFGVIPSTDQSVSMLMFSFVFSVLELITVIPAIIKLFDGVLYLSSRHGGEAAYMPCCRMRTAARHKDTASHGKTITEGVRNATIWFVVIKSICRMLPEFSALSEQGYEDSAWGQIYRYIGILRVLGIAVALVAAIIWMVRMLRFVSVMKRDTALLDNLGKKYEDDILTQTDRPARRAIKTAFGCFGVGAALALDLYFDNFNVLPDVLTAVCFLAGLLIIRKYINGLQLTAVCAVLFGALSVVFTIVEYRFNYLFYSGAIYKDEQAYDTYILMCVLAIAAAVAFVVMNVVFLFTVMSKIIDRYTGFAMTTNDTYDPSERIRLLHIELKRKYYAPLVCAVLAGVASVISRVLINEIDFGWIVEFVTIIAYAILIIKLLVNVNEQIDYKYMLD